MMESNDRLGEMEDRAKNDFEDLSEVLERSHSDHQPDALQVWLELV